MFTTLALASVVNNKDPINALILPPLVHCTAVVALMWLGCVHAQVNKNCDPMYAEK